MRQRACLVPFVLALAACASTAVAQDATPRYGLRQQEPDTGTHIRREFISGSVIPLDKRYAELTVEQQRLFKSQYEEMDADDEPPFPAEGLRRIYQRIGDAQQKLGVFGPLSAAVQVDSAGQATSVQVFRSPDPGMTQVVAMILMLEAYKPARCAGQPCAMQFPVRLDFDRRR